MGLYRALHWVCCFLLLLTACQKAPPTSESAPPPPPEPAVTNAVVTSVEGEVAVRTTGAWSDLDVGAEVGQSAQVKTGASGTCDLQFGSYGVVHLSARTLVSLKTIDLRPSRRAVTVELIGGTVAAKVNKLVGLDQFGVQTNAVQAGVRGTRFVVTKVGERTLVAVAEGVVALVPPVEVPPAVAERILEASPQVTVGNQAEVTPESMEGPTKALEAMTSAAALDQVVDAYREAARSPGVPVSQPATKATQTLLNQSLELDLRPELPPAPAPAPKGAPRPTKPAPQGLAAPRALAPTPGQKIDILKQDSVNFQWKAVDGATGYQVTLVSLADTPASTVKRWTTAETQVNLDRFDSLKAGPYAWVVVATTDGDPPLTSPPTRTTFAITKGGQLSAPTLELTE